MRDSIYKSQSAFLSFRNGLLLVVVLGLALLNIWQLNWHGANVEDPISVSRVLLAIFLGGIIFAITVAITLIFFVVFRKVSTYRQIGRSLHDINHYLRDRINEVVYRDVGLWATGKGVTFDLLKKNELLSFERYSLDYICRKIGVIFGHLTGRNCTVSVFLKVVDGKETLKAGEHLAASKSGNLSVFLWASGSTSADRRSDGPFSEIVTKDTVFHALNEIRQGGGPRAEHFVLDNNFNGSDKEATYKDTQIFGTSNLGKPGSLIVVPIACIYERDGEKVDECIGYLSVECVSRNRFYPNPLVKENLDWPEHVQYLSAFSDQIFTFISLCRGRGGGEKNRLDEERSML